MTQDVLAETLREFRVAFSQLKAEVGKGIVGYDDLITDVLVAMFCQGHVLLEGVPGLGKTHLVKTLSRAVGLDSGRVQCTPDLMPADILGTQIVREGPNGGRDLVFEKGPVFRHVMLVDEINRATPKTQAALLEVMQEHGVTVAGERHALPNPFFVLATQNPMEMEGTYPLPEAQLDRFLFKIQVPYPKLEALVEISRRTTAGLPPDINAVLKREDLLRFQSALLEVPVADSITQAAARLVLATHPDQPGASDEVRRFASYGASPRGLQALIRGAKTHAALDGRTAVGFADVRRVALISLRHRVILNFEGDAEKVRVDAMLGKLLQDFGKIS